MVIAYEPVWAIGEHRRHSILFGGNSVNLFVNLFASATKRFSLNKMVEKHEHEQQNIRAPSPPRPGTGLVATPDQAQETHANIRSWLSTAVSPVRVE